MVSVRDKTGVALGLSRRGVLRGAGALLPLALGGCSFFDDMFADDKKILPGHRESVLAPTRTLGIDDSLTEAVSVPAPSFNSAWLQTGGTASHLVGNPALPGINQAWQASVGHPGGYRDKLIAQPVVSGDRVWVMDSRASVSAFDLKTGAQAWRVDTRSKDDRGATATGGGLAYADGRLYVVTGRADALALDAGTGKTLWRVSTTVPAMSAPTLDGGVLYFGTIDQKLRALSLADGHQLWEYQASPTDKAVLEQPAPAVGNGVVVAGFASGDIVALDARTGAIDWSDNLAAVRNQSGLSDFSSIVAAPVIQDGTVYAVGLGGLFVAIDLRSGRRVWEDDTSGSRTPWVVGDWVFMITDEQKLVCFRASDGRARWISDLPRYGNVAKQKDPIYWAGPLLAGSKLFVASDHKQMFVLDPLDGKQVGAVKLKTAVSVMPVAAASKLLVLGDNGMLTAYS